MRETYTGILTAHAECETCGWSTHTRNALGLAAQHHDRLGHVVRAEQTIGVRYGGGQRGARKR
jgi:hypothetical protein